MGKDIFFRGCRIRPVRCVLFFMTLIFMQSITFSAPAFSADGDLDTAGFNSPNGYTIADLGGAANAQSIAIQTDGKIVVSFSLSSIIYVVRLTTGGSYDTTFDTDGIKTIDIAGGTETVSTNGSNVLGIQSDNKIVVGARWNKDPGYAQFAVVRLNTDGSLDTSFDTDGIQTTDFGDSAYLESLTIQPSDGKIVAAGYARDGSDWGFALARYNTDGSLDTSFNTDGKLMTQLTVDQDYAESVAIQSDGKIVAAGKSDQGPNDDWAVVRYNTDGSLDTASFGSPNGYVTTDVNTDHNSANAVAIQSDGKIVAAGYANSSGGSSRFMVARYMSEEEFPWVMFIPAIIKKK